MAGNRVKKRGRVIYNNTAHRIILKRDKNNKLDFSDFTLLTGMAALCYIISITLGSGSFKEYFSGTTEKILTVCLFQALAFTSIAFLIYLTEYISIKLSLRKPKSYKFPVLSKARKYILVLAASVLLLAVIIKLDYYLYPSNKSPIRDTVSILLALFSGVLATISFMAHMAYEIMKDGWRTWAFFLVFGFVSIMVWLNAFRDAEKEAYIIDNKYCYWLRSSLAVDITRDQRDKLLAGENVPLTPEQHSYYFSPTCISKIQSGIDHRAIYVTQ